MQQANVKKASGAIASFSAWLHQSKSGNDPSKAVAENEDADERSCSFLPKSFNISEFYIILPTDGGIS